MRFLNVLLLTLFFLRPVLAQEDPGDSSKEPTPPPTAEVLPPEQDESQARETFEEGLERYEEEAYAEALPLFDTVVRNHPESAIRLDALFMSAECLWAMNRLRDAHSRYARLLETDYRNLSRVIERMYQVGAAFLEGPMREELDDPEFGFQVLRSLVERNFEGPFMDHTRYLIAKFYLEQDAHLDAIDAYEHLMERHPGSSWSELARYEIALAYTGQGQGFAYDVTVYEKAEKRLTAYVANPDAPKLEEARRTLMELRENLGERNIWIARNYWNRHDRGLAAAIYLTDVLERFPRTRAAERAATLLKRIIDASSDEQVEEEARDVLREWARTTSDT